MKNLLIAGVAKSGKSTICEKICEEEKYNHIPFDYITASMKRNYPEWGVKSDVIINETSKILCTLFKTITDIINDTDEKFIIDCVIVSALAVCPKRERLSYDQRSRDGLRDERDFDWSYGNDRPGCGRG